MRRSQKTHCQEGCIVSVLHVHVVYVDGKDNRQIYWL